MISHMGRSAGSSHRRTTMAVGDVAGGTLTTTATTTLRGIGPVALPAAAGLAALAVGGAVAGLTAAVYGALIIREWRRHRRGLRHRRSIRRVIDTVTELAAELRIGRPAPAAFADAMALLVGVAHAGPRVAGGRRTGRVEPSTMAAVRLGAVWRFADATGAPLSDLLDRFAAEVRATQDVHAVATAQTAGARATGWLLAALPAAALPVGYAMGVDPGTTLLHTSLGELCVVAALILQSLGLLWADHLVHGRP